jgi:hypothetical protein
MMAPAEKPYNLRITAVAGGLEPAVNPLLHRHGFPGALEYCLR